MGCGSPSKQTITQTSQPPPEYMAAYKQVLGQAQGVAGQPLQQYGGDQVAGFTPTQQQAFGAIDQAQGAASPYLQQANQFLQQASSPLWSNVAQFSPGATQQYQPGNVPSFGDISQYSPNLPGFGQLGNYAPNLPQFSQQALQNFLPQGFNPVSTINPSSINFSPQQFSGSALNQYESPYTHDVVNATQAQFANQNAQQANQLKGTAASAGAFGGDREAVMQSQLANQQQLAQAPIIAGLENQGFQTALGEFNTQQQTGLQAQQATADARLAAQQQAIGQNLSGYGLGLQGYGQGLAELNQQQQLALQGYGAGVGALQGQQQLGLQGFGAGLGALTGQQALAMQQFGTGLGEFNTQQQQQLAANEANAWLASQAGFGSMNLASQAQNLPLSAASAQLQSGALQQQLSQEQLNIPYEQFLQQQAYPFQTASFLANIAEGLGSNAGGTGTSTQPQGSLGSTLGGLGITGLALNNMGAFNGLGSLFGSSGAGAPFGGNMPISAKAGGKVIPFRKRGGMIPRRDMGGGLNLTGMPYEDQTLQPGLGKTGLLPQVPNVDVSVVPQTAVTHGGGPPHPGAIAASGGGGGGGLGSMLGMASMFGGGSGTTTASGGGTSDFQKGLTAALDVAKIAMLFMGHNGGAVRRNGGMIAHRDMGGAMPYQEMPLMPNVPNVDISIVPQTETTHGKGPPAAPQPSEKSQQDDQQQMLQMLTLAKQMGLGSGGDNTTSAARGGMVPRRADGGANDNDDIEPIQMTAPPVSRTQMLGDNYGFTAPPAAKITPEKPDINMALLAAGLGMMSGKSTNMFQNLGQGALLGLKEYQGEKALNQTAAEKQAQLDEEHNRDTISTQEAKTRAAQLADDMDQRRVQQFNQQSNADRNFYETQKRDAQAAKNEDAQRRLQQQLLNQGRVTDFDKKYDAAKRLKMSEADALAYAGSPYAFIHQGAMGKYEVGFAGMGSQPNAAPGSAAPAAAPEPKIGPVGAQKPESEIPAYDPGTNALGMQPWQQGAMTDTAKNAANEIKALDKAAQDASQNRADLGTLRTMLNSPGFTTDKLAPVKAAVSAAINAGVNTFAPGSGGKVAQSMTGIDPAKADIFNKDATRMGLTFARNTEGAREAVQAIQIALGANPQMTNTLEGNKAIVDLLDAPAKRTLDEQKYAQAWFNKNKSYLGFQSWWNEHHPVQEYTSRVVPYHLPLDKSGKVAANDLLPNVTYQTNRGNAYWDGEHFVGAQ